jgi:hypothetical protein
MPSALTAPIYNDVRYYLGDPQVPRSIKNVRQSTMEAMRRVGTPVLLKRRYTPGDVDKGVAQVSPARDTTFGASRQNDPLSYGVGFVSLDTQPGEWWDPATQTLTVTDQFANAPTNTAVPAPRYRGYGPGFLTYVILPDRPEDVFRIDPRGVMTQIQQAKLQLPWWPIVGDSDIMIVVDLDQAGRIANAYERYVLHQVQPITMRGMDRSGRRETTSANAGGNRFWVGQECEASMIPENSNNPIYNVEIDR